MGYQRIDEEDSIEFLFLPPFCLDGNGNWHNGAGKDGQGDCQKSVLGFSNQGQHTSHK